MAGKTTAGKKPAAKKKQAKSAPSRKAAAPSPERASAPAPGRRNNAPLYLLLVLALAAALLIVVNNRYPGSSPDDGVRQHAGAKGKKDPGTPVQVIPGAQRGGDAKKAEEGKAIPEREVSIFLVRFDERTEKTSMAAVRRKVNAENPLDGALTALIAGPSAGEKRRGYLTAVPATLRVLDSKIQNGNAVIDFSGDIEWGATGSVLLSRIDQIVYTATQFEGVGGVIIRINGRRKNFIGSDGLAIGGPLHRK